MTPFDQVLPLGTLKEVRALVKDLEITHAVRTELFLTQTDAVARLRLNVCRLQREWNRKYSVKALKKYQAPAGQESEIGRIWIQRKA